MKFVYKAEKTLQINDLDNFGKLLHESWLAKRDLSSSITNLNINDIYTSALKKGALGGKLLGAGGGGFFLFYVPYSKQKKFISYFKNLINVPFNFSSQGSKIMFKNIENKII